MDRSPRTTCRFLGSVKELLRDKDSSQTEGVLGGVLPALYDDGASHTRFQCSEILVFGRHQAMLVGDGGRSMADAHEEKALLGLCNAHCLKLSTPSRARSAPCTRAAFQHIP